jgi:hypothetical protein
MAVALKIDKPGEGDQRLELKDQLKNILEEARMVLPGIQALFGFQMIAVFNESFSKLSHDAKVVHLTATALTTLAIALSMAPAAFHRIIEPDHVSSRLVKVCTCLLAWGMAPLALAIALDMYLVTRIAFKDSPADWILGATAGAVLLGLWFCWPLLQKSRSPR